MSAETQDELGRPLVTLHRSLRGLLVTGAILVLVCGGLAGWNMVMRQSSVGAFGVGLAIVMGVILVGFFLRTTRALTAHEEGLHLERFVGAARTLEWGQVESVRIWRAPLGKRPVVVTIRVAGQAAISAGEAEFGNVPKLIEVLSERVRDRVVDERG